ncbi:putative transcription factor, CoiA-like family [Waddlia chondrophila 2032/99]|uniref:Putative transcription factor, CoiA-like family n=2 Tax=Waddlia chondrophila TaxID=71667 RepID=D6YT86_WADCW|nr:competence protein CoiA family protein [Waddlia chondrophila]ADI39281.1 putative transcription factor, CoiA-like family [Waddlia chondrophila WSU 86-1044]CCB90570.1 putative transcription factor, CoiA-like family [Waddlia chondrophila 2032/99]
MQLFALTVEKEVVAAVDAVKKTEYYCMECSKPVRLRGGRHRQDHFYHLNPDPSCRQSQKSLNHLQVQWHLFHLLPDDEVVLERRFPEISRIADVAWERRKLIFEVQCSPISQREVEERNRDYASIGYEVVWILHERRFVRKQVAAAEEWLKDHLCYYTNFDEEGRGEIYDQLHLFSGGFRSYSSKKTAVNLSLPSKVKGKFAFEGDWKYRLMLRDPCALDVWNQWEKRKKQQFPSYKFRPMHELKRWYLNLLRLLLEENSTQGKGCR